jgi:hypothetical protein
MPPDMSVPGGTISIMGEVLYFQPLNLSVVGGLILIVEKSVVFSATCLKPLILAYFRVSEE